MYTELQGRLDTLRDTCETRKRSFLQKTKDIVSVACATELLALALAQASRHAVHQLLEAATTTTATTVCAMLNFCAESTLLLSTILCVVFSRRLNRHRLGPNITTQSEPDRPSQKVGPKSGPLYLLSCLTSSDCVSAARPVYMT